MPSIILIKSASVVQAFLSTKTVRGADARWPGGQLLGTAEEGERARGTERQRLSLSLSLAFFGSSVYAGDWTLVDDKDAAFHKEALGRCSGSQTL